MSYDYRVADVIRVVDGDTLDLRVDVGFYMSAGLRFRLLGVDTPERGQPNWSEATTFVYGWLDERWDRLRVRTYKADSFGRWLAEVYSINPEERLNEALLNAGLAVRR